MSSTGTIPAGPIVEAAWLRARLGLTPHISVVDASWRMPGNGIAHDDYMLRHITGAIFLDIDAVADPRTDLPHMLPAEGEFARWAGANGISGKTPVVVYDDQGLFSAARAWWMFRVMGLEQVFVLNGGLPAWMEAGGAITAAPSLPSPAEYSIPGRPHLVADAAAVRRCAQAACHKRYRRETG